MEYWFSISSTSLLLHVPRAGSLLYFLISQSRELQRVCREVMSYLGSLAALSISSPCLQLRESLTLSWKEIESDWKRAPGSENCPGLLQSLLSALSHCLTVGSTVFPKVSVILNGGGGSLGMKLIYNIWVGNSIHTCAQFLKEIFSCVGIWNGGILIAFWGDVLVFEIQISP